MKNIKMDRILVNKKAGFLRLNYKTHINFNISEGMANGK
nr:MAG TPA: hypothetical protein [Caudoviricetes sp.]